LAAPLGRYARVVMFDKRGTNLSDRVADLPGLDQRMDDLRAVTDAAGIEQAALLGFRSWHDVGAVRRDLSQSRLLNHSLKGVPEIGASLQSNGECAEGPSRGDPGRL
jgi:hypothetical protein